MLITAQDYSNWYHKCCPQRSTNTISTKTTNATDLMQVLDSTSLMQVCVCHQVTCNLLASTNCIKIKLDTTFKIFADLPQVVEVIYIKLVDKKS